VPSWLLGTAHRPPVSGIPPQATRRLHGAPDGCIGVIVAGAASPLLADGFAVDVVAEAGRFRDLERSDTVNDRIVEFVTA
jgi:hypothetical protein